MINGLMIVVVSAVLKITIFESIRCWRMIWIKIWIKIWIMSSFNKFLIVTWIKEEHFVNFAKKCFDCKRFKLLCSEYFTITILSNRNFDIYVTAVRFNARNWKYPKTQAMTLDISNSRIIEDSFLLKIKKGEEQLHEVINELQKANVWWFFVKKFFCFSKNLVWKIDLKCVVLIMILFTSLLSVIDWTVK